MRVKFIGRAACVAASILVSIAAAATAAPVKLARHPDYHAGRIAFSYLGDIWTANEDGTSLHRVTDTRSGSLSGFSPTANGRFLLHRTATTTRSSSRSPAACPAG